MLWFFERGGKRLQCEIRSSRRAAGYELGGARGEKFTPNAPENPDELAKRWFELEQQWKQDGWMKKLDD